MNRKLAIAVIIVFVTVLLGFLGYRHMTHIQETTLAPSQAATGPLGKNVTAETTESELDDPSIEAVADETRLLAKIGPYDETMSHQIFRQGDGASVYTHSRFHIVDRNTKKPALFSDFFTDQSLLNALFPTIIDEFGALKEEEFAATFQKVREVKSVTSFNQMIDKLTDLEFSFCMDTEEPECQKFNLETHDFAIIGYNTMTKKAIVLFGYQIFGSTADLVYPRLRLELDIKADKVEMIRSAQAKRDGYMPKEEDLRVCQTCIPYEGDVRIDGHND